MAVNLKKGLFIEVLLKRAGVYRLRGKYDKYLTSVEKNLKD